MSETMTNEQIMSAIRESPLGLGFEALSQFSAAKWSQRLIMTTWAAHTHTHRKFVVTPRLYFCADGPASGKTVNMEVTVSMARDAESVGYASQASVYQYLEAHPDTTFALDEIDKAFGADGRGRGRPILAAVVNDGYRAAGQVMVVRGGKTVKMPIYAPVAMAGIGTLPHDTLTRCIPIKLEIGVPDMIYLAELYESDMKFIGDNMAEWLNTKDSQEFLAAQPKLADFPGDPRFRLITSPLFAIANLAGIGDVFKIAVKELQTGIAQNPPTPKSVLFLRDLRDMWPEGEKMQDAQEIISLVKSHPRRRWDGMSQSRIGEMTVAGMLRDSGISTTVTSGRRGYLGRDIFKASIPEQFRLKPSESDTPDKE